MILDLCSKLGATVDSIEMDYLLSYLIAVPRKEVQDEIIGFLESASEAIDQISDSLGTRIGLLDEYLSAVITDLVTGEFELRDHA